MKKRGDAQAQFVFAIVFAGLSAPAHAQLGGILDKAQKAQDAKKKLDALMVSDEEEHKIGADVSAKIRQRFGVVQDADVHKYVTLVGTLLAQQSERPTLPWTFIVLDTDGVNAFASPGGFVHITRGALGLIKNEAELAGVLAHEIGHVAHKHTVNAIRKNKAVQLGTSETLSDRGPFLDKLANKAYEMVLENKFDRGDELDADKVSVALTQKAGYAPASLADFLARLDDRNKDEPERNGLFASHPETKERIDKIRQLAGAKSRRHRRGALQGEHQIRGGADHGDRGRRGRRVGADRVEPMPRARTRTKTRPRRPRSRRRRASASAA